MATTSKGQILKVDLNEAKITDKICKAHSSDINCLSFKDQNVFATGSDDCLLKLWDLRMEPAKKCVGGFVGHNEGLTSVSC